MPKIKVNDVNLYYEIRGHGFPFVMITGLGGNIDYWDPRLLDALSKRFKLVLFDNRGSGRSDVSDRKQYTIKLLAEDTVGLMDALNVPKAHIFGLSMGGMIAQELALNFPERVERLILCSTFCGGPKAVLPPLLPPPHIGREVAPPKEAVKNSLRAVFTEEFIRTHSEIVEFTVQQMMKAPAPIEGFMRQLDAIKKFNTYDRLKQIKAPTLILHGKKDIVIPPENALILAEEIPNAKLVYLENSAHGLVEEIDKVIKAILDFLS
ncbi:MAG: alpha/beta fold hydrolase [Nitrososphaerota archaeon]|nr:alpha/beta hydrolase [Candidatus Bathyarchaeota archaeon]MDW8023955.1 alpha/beta fold hydrolase [Nitrososphaerota archaeon]